VAFAAPAVRERDSEKTEQQDGERVPEFHSWVSIRNRVERPAGSLFGCEDEE